MPLPSAPLPVAPPDTPSEAPADAPPSQPAGCRRRQALALLAATACLPARAQPRFPDRPITLVVPFSPGGIADLTARAVGEALARSLGQPVVIDNQPGAGAVVASQKVAHAAPNGHTLLLLSNANAVAVSLLKPPGPDPLKLFAPISTLGAFDLGVFAPGGAGGRFATLGAALAWARANPGRLNIGTIAAGSTQHLAAKLFEARAGIDALVVPYKGSPAVLTALRAGDVDLVVEIVGPMLPQLKAGTVRALAVTSAQRHPLLPDVPTAAQAGVAGLEVASWNALAAPAGTPAAVIDTLNRAVRDALAQPAVQQRLAPVGVRLAAGSPAELQALLSSEIRRWGDLVKSAKIEAD
jgi:tripartite-type tricarboxylate transporter receptor subunit TctC